MFEHFAFFVAFKKQWTAIRANVVVSCILLYDLHVGEMIYLLYSNLSAIFVLSASSAGKVASISMCWLFSVQRRTVSELSTSSCSDRSSVAMMNVTSAGVITSELKDEFLRQGQLVDYEPLFWFLKKVSSL